jgi:hypothetical protein
LSFEPRAKNFPCNKKRGMSAFMIFIAPFHTQKHFQNAEIQSTTTAKYEG